MTSLFAHKVAQPTKWRFLPKNLSQPANIMWKRRFIELYVSQRSTVHTNLKDNFFYSTSSVYETYLIKITFFHFSKRNEKKIWCVSYCRFLCIPSPVTSFKYDSKLLLTIHCLKYIVLIISKINSHDFIFTITRYIFSQKQFSKQ